MLSARRIGMLLFLAVVVGLPLAFAASHLLGRMHRFDGLAGPTSATPPIGDAEPARWQSFRRADGSRLAILLTDERAPWLGLAHGLRALGVPFTITRDVEEATRQAVVIVYPVVSGRVLSEPEVVRLDRHVREGGTLVGTGVLGALSDLFGLREVSERRDRFEVRLSEAAAAWGGLAEPEERLWNLGRRHDPGGARNAEAQFGTYGYAVGDAETLASFDDGAAALTRRIVGRGRAYALGFDPGALLLAGQSARAQDVERVYANGYTPQNDALLAILVRIWREGDPLAVSLAPVPDGRDLAVVLTFDVDFTRSLSQAVAYAELLRSHDVRGTFFVQAKYMRDYNDDIILNEAAKLHLRRLHDELGMELASHTVSHSNAFRSFEMGSGRESYPDYRPVALSRDRAEGGTILGELRVSKYLLEALAPGSRVTSFRPGHLSQPFAMPQALQATGYLYSSTATAGTALSHLPYRLTHDRGPSASTGIFEFPITIEDELGLFMGSRLGPALDVARKVAGRRGILVVLTHPNVLGHKLDFNRRLIEALRGTAWFGALDDLGSWWAARDGLEMVVEAQARDAVVRLDAAAPLSGLTLAVPSDWRLAGTEGDVDGARPSPGRVVLGRLTGRAALRFEVDRASDR